MQFTETKHKIIPLTLIAILTFFFPYPQMSCSPSLRLELFSSWRRRISGCRLANFNSVYRTSTPEHRSTKLYQIKLQALKRTTIN